MALTPAVTADVAADQRFGALITDISIGDTGAASSDFFSLGTLDEGSLVLEPRVQNSSGGIPQIMAYKIIFTAMVLASGTNISAALNSIIQNDHDTTLTDVEGSKYTYLNAYFKLTAGRALEGDLEGMVKIPITGGGYLTKALFDSTFTSV